MPITYSRTVTLSRPSQFVVGEWTKFHSEPGDHLGAETIERVIDNAAHLGMLLDTHGPLLATLCDENGAELERVEILPTDGNRSS